MKIFYDLGTHMFGGLLEFNKHFKFDHTWQIYCFEANPYTYKKAKEKLETDPFLKTLDINLINAAISDSDDIIDLECYYDTQVNDYIDVGSTAFTLRHDYFKSIHQGMYNDMGDNYCKVEKVRSICFSEFLKNSVRAGDEAYIKMDIEGCEFRTLSKMIVDNTHVLARMMFIEWHERFWPAEQDQYAQLKNNIMMRLVNDGVDARIWW